MGLYLLLFTVVYCYSIQLVEVKEEEDFVVVSPMIPSNGAYVHTYIHTYIYIIYVNT